MASLIEVTARGAGVGVRRGVGAGVGFLPVAGVAPGLVAPADGATPPEPPGVELDPAPVELAALPPGARLAWPMPELGDGLPPGLAVAVRVQPARMTITTTPSSAPTRTRVDDSGLVFGLSGVGGVGSVGDVIGASP